MVTAAQRYDALQSERNWYLDRARACSSLTLPYLIPSANEPGRNHRDTWTLPWNGIGSRGVLNLASRMLMALLPPNEPFFRFTLNEVEMERAGLPEEARSEMEKALSRMEQEVLKSIEATNDRVAVHEALLWLLVAGNALLHVGEKGLRVIHLNSFVVSRDPVGNPLDLVICEELARSMLPPAALALLEEQEGRPPLGAEREPLQDEQNTVRVFTWVRWDRQGNTTWSQELGGKEIPGTSGKAPAQSNPWLPLRMSRVDGGSYGVSYVEAAAIADLNTAEHLSQALAEGSLAAAKLLFLVNPAGVTKAENLAKSANGAFVPGDRRDVESLQSEKAMDLRVAMEALARVEARLAQAFMLADVRDSERTTAEEVRLQALQIENSLGAIYGILSSEFQSPYVSRKLDLLMRSGSVPALPKDMVRPVVSVGLAAVGRSNELERLMRFVGVLGQAIPDAIPAYVLPGELIKRLAYSLGIPTLNLIRTDEQIAQAQQQAEQQQLEQQLMASPMADPQKQAMATQINQQTLASGNGVGPAEPPTEPQEIPQ